LVARLRESVKPKGAKEAVDGLGPHDAETLAAWEEAARERGAVLFVGAGWTRNAVPAPRLYEGQPEDEPIPLLWSHLASLFRKALDHDVGKSAQDLDPLWLAELYRQRHGEDALHTLLRQAVPDERLRPGALHEALTVIPWHAILTTNYDSLLTRAFQPVRRVRTCIEDVDLVRSATKDAIELIHLHGVLDRPKTIVLALEDYRRYPNEHPGLLAKVRQLFLQHPVLFVGFGVTDPNFAQWAGWLSDVVGNVQNPWVSLSMDPTPSLSHARYWGTRLNFISVRPVARLRVVVPHILGALAEMLDDEDRSRDVALVRIRITKDPAATVQEVRALLDTGARRGVEGWEWDRDRLWMLNAAASHVLDLASIDWRAPPPKSTTPGIMIDARRPNLLKQDDELVSQLRTAFRDAWGEWRDLLRPLLGADTWVFERVDLSRGRLPDLNNRTPVPLTEDGQKGDKSCVEGGDPSAGGTGDPDLDALRAGLMPRVPSVPERAREHRMLGYLAYQRGQWKLAAAHFNSAADASRTEYEPLRCEWLTLRSRLACLENAFFRGPGDERDAVRVEQEAVRGTLRKVRKALRALPPEEAELALAYEATEAEAKVGAQFVDDLDRDDIDGTMRLGHIFGSAEDSLDRLERMWVAPPLAAEAADALGTLQWRYGQWAAAAKTLARYGSSRLKKMSSAITRSFEIDSTQLEGLIDELLCDGRWPGEWLARVEGLVELVPACSEGQLDRLAVFLKDARGAVADATEIIRGRSVEYRWSALATIDRLEVARWPVLTPRQALDAVEQWVALPGGSLGPGGRRPIVAINRLPWRQWVEAGHVAAAQLAIVLENLAKGRLDAKPSHGEEADLSATLILAVSLSRQKVVGLAAGTPLRTIIDQLVAKVPEADRGWFETCLAQLDGDDRQLAQLVERAIAAPSISASTVDTIGVAPEFAANHLATLSASVAQAIETLTQRPSQDRRRWSGDWVERARLYGFLVGRLLTVGPAAIESVAPLAHALLKATPVAAEHLVVGHEAIPAALMHEVDDAVTALLRGASPDRYLSRREQQYAGLRGVTRGIVERGAATPPDWLAAVAALTTVTDPDLAAYATWILSEWAVRRRSGEQEEAVDRLVAPALQTAAFDSRAGVRADAARGLQALLGSSQPERATSIASVVERLKADRSVAVLRALAGTGSLQP
jgi:hypothetical protein